MRFLHDELNQVETGAKVVTRKGLDRALFEGSQSVESQKDPGPEERGIGHPGVEALIGPIGRKAGSCAGYEREAFATLEKQARCGWTIVRQAEGHAVRFQDADPWELPACRWERLDAKLPVDGATLVVLVTEPAGT